MAVYYIGTYDITNSEEFQKYPPRVAAILPKYGGETVAVDVEPVVLEGSPRKMNAIIKFPSMEAAMGMYNDPEYQNEIKPIRIANTGNTTMILVREFVRK